MVVTKSYKATLINQRFTCTVLVFDREKLRAGGLECERVKVKKRTKQCSSVVIVLFIYK